MKNRTKQLIAYGIPPLIMLPLGVFAAELHNPLGTVDIRTIIRRLIQAILSITGSVALLMFIWGGFLWLISAGNEERVKKGKEVMKWAGLGLAVIIGAYVLVRTLVLVLETGEVIAP